MADDQIRALKTVLGVASDIELARALGVERSSVSQWKRRGAVPKKYAALAGLEAAVQDADRLKNATRHNLFGRTDNHYWLKAALAFLPANLPEGRNSSLANIGSGREAPLILLVHLAMWATSEYLGKPRCESESDYQALIAALEANEADRMLSIIRPLLLERAREQVIESPQSESSIGASEEKDE